MIKNILHPNTPDAGSISTTTTQNWVLFKGKVYFVASDQNVYGTEIYRTDGTTQGTELFIDLAGGIFSKYPHSLTVAGDKLFFLGDYKTNGYELWVTDGTVNGTRIIPNVEALPEYYSLGNIIAHNGVLYFTAYNQYGYEVWRSDGTEAGTRMLKDLTNGLGLQTIMPILRSSPNSLWIGAWNQSSQKFEIWKSDGTEAGTTNVTGLNVLTSLYAPSLTTVGNTIYIIGNDGVNGNEIWKSDGTQAGTVMVTKENGDMSPYTKSWKDLVFYNKDLGGGVKKFYRSDGTTAGTFALADIYPNIQESIEYNGKLYFYNGNELWRTDGTVVGTKKINTPTDFVRGGTVSVLNDKLLIMSSYPATNETYQAVWVYDETNGLVKTTSQMHVTSPSTFNVMPVVNNKAIYFSNDGTHGYEPSGITETNVEMLGNLNKARSGFYPDQMTNVGNNILFSFNDLDHGTELWKTDGTEGGTMLVKDIVPGPGAPSFFSNFVEKKGLLFFTAADGQPGKLWRSDGTEAGTFKVETQALSTTQVEIGRSSPVVGDFAYFEVASELWKTDGTVAGTSMVKNVNGVTSNFATIGNNFLFIDYEHNLWKSDGTTAGTNQVFNFKTAFTQQNLLSFSFIQAQNQAFIIGAISGSSEVPLFRTDGTLSGTTIVDYFTNTSGSGPVVIGVLNNVIYYRANDTEHGYELWRSDGTTAGTKMLRDLRTGPEPSMPIVMYADKNVIYFSSFDGTSRSIWKLDASETLTLIATIPVDSLYPARLIGDKLYFISTLGGGELYRTDGTAQGTQSMGEIIKGSGGSMHAVYNIGDRLVLVANHLDYGVGLWTTDPAYVPKTYQSITFPSIDSRKSSDAPFTLTATASSGLPVLLEVVSGPATISGSTVTITGAGTVTIRASQAGNSSIEAAFPILRSFVVEQAGPVTGLEEDEVAVSVSPNPATDKLLINAPASKYRTVALVDPLGRNVSSININRDETSIDVGHLPRGMYVVTLRTFGNANVSRKIVLH